VEATTRLAEPVYSHLNLFSFITAKTEGRLFLSLSPCPSQKIEVLPFDYPVGRPARLAYLGADGIFRIVQASSGEKGPFAELASGALARDEALAITFHEGERPACRVVFRDWAAQASTLLSPSAGWGLPQNAVEFSLDNSSGEAYIYVTLAATSVGRGWDSVGHAAGTYRNRVLVEPLE